MQSLQYLQDISKGVAAGIAAGRSLAEIQKTLTLDAYKGFERWDTIREAHIAAVYATISGYAPVGIDRYAVTRTLRGECLWPGCRRDARWCFLAGLAATPSLVQTQTATGSDPGQSGVSRAHDHREPPLCRDRER